MKILLIPVAFLLLSGCNNNKKKEKDKGGMLPDSTTATARDVSGNPVTEDAERSITGTWRPVSMNLRDMEEEEKKEMIDNIRVEFTTDGKFFGYNKDKKQEGTYTYNKKDKLHTFNNAERCDNPEKFTIGWEGELMLMINEEGTVKLKKE